MTFYGTENNIILENRQGRVVIVRTPKFQNGNSELQNIPPNTPNNPFHNNYITEGAVQGAMANNHIPTPHILELSPDKMVMEYMPGQCPSNPENDTLLPPLPLNIWENAGALLGRIHGINYNQPIISMGNYIDYLYGMVRGKDNLAVEPLIQMAIKTDNLHKKTYGHCVQNHGDYRFGNILHHNGQLAILDWAYSKHTTHYADLGYFCALQSHYNPAYFGVGEYNQFINGYLAQNPHIAINPQILYFFEFIGLMQWFLLYWRGLGGAYPNDFLKIHQKLQEYSKNI